MGRKVGTWENKKNHNKCLKLKFLDEIEEKLKFMATNDYSSSLKEKVLTISKNLSQSSSDTYIM